MGVEEWPEWLRREGAYRAYVRGLRYWMLGFLLICLDLLVAATGAVPAPVIAGVAISAFALGIPSIVSAVIGWIMIPGKNRANARQGVFLGMAVRDIFKGLPKKHDLTLQGYSEGSMYR
jgi:hypothetical protein